VYCLQLGYALTSEQCAFPDGTSCEQWSFYRGECGQAHSFCNLHGGTVANKTEDMGTWTASYALCTLPSGSSCHEDAFARSCSCE
jgi:putative hemolysin